VWGLSSMGAIRAREMAPLGMRGFGRVYARFMESGDFQDDEVALLHAPTPPYRAMTEPLIHLRAAIAHLVATGVVEKTDGEAVVRDLKSRWYGERTLRGTVDALGERARGGAAAVRGELGDFRRFAWKTRDLEEFVEGRVWERDGEARGEREERRGPAGGRGGGMKKMRSLESGNSKTEG
jgi:TfuA-like protein